YCSWRESGTLFIEDNLAGQSSMSSIYTGHAYSFPPFSAPPPGSSGNPLPELDPVHSPSNPGPNRATPRQAYRSEAVEPKRHRRLLTRANLHFGPHVLVLDLASVSSQYLLSRGGSTDSSPLCHPWAHGRRKLQRLLSSPYQTLLGVPQKDLSQ